MSTRRPRPLRPRASSARRIGLVLALLAAACGGAGGSQGSGGGGDWYYHWNCNGDAQCLALNPTGQAIGTVDEGPSYQMCAPLLEFASRNWGPAAWNQCDQSATFPRVLVRLEVAPGGATLGQGATQPYTATARYSDGTSADVTGQAAWSVVTTSGSGVASITAAGLLTALAQGTATVTARMGSISGTASLAVGPVAIVWVEVLPANPTIPRGQTQAFTATAHWSDGHTTNVTATAGWSSQSTAVATMSGAVATGQGAGTSTITAYAGGKSGNTLLTVTGPVLVAVAVRPDAPKVAAGTSRQLTAVGTWSDSTARDVTLDATWASSVTGVATFSSPGVVNGVGTGTTVVSASMGDVTGVTTVTVTPSTLQTVSISPAQPSLGAGETQTFSAIGSFSDGTSYPIPAGVTWASSAPATVAIDPTGLATALALGTAGISASYDGVVGATTVTVTGSTPGTTWTWRNTGITQGGTGALPYQLNAVVWTGSQLVAAGAAGAVLTSPDGLAWTFHATPTPYVRGLAYAPELGLVVAVGGDATSGSVWTSPDGVSWTKALSTSQLAAVAWSGTLFVAVGSQQTGNALVYTSPDGVTWTQRTPGTAQVLVAVTWNGAEFVAVGNATVVSADGVHWTVSPDASNALYGVAWSPKLGRFVKVSSGGQVRLSPDGLSWAITATPGVNLYGVIWAGNRFVAVGGSGSPADVFTSTDGVGWSQGTVDGTGILYGVGATSYFRAVAWTGTRLVGVGDAVPVGAPGNYTWFIETSP